MASLDLNNQASLLKRVGALEADLARARADASTAQSNLVFLVQKLAGHSSARDADDEIKFSKLELELSEQRRKNAELQLSILEQSTSCQPKVPSPIPSAPKQDPSPPSPPLPGFVLFKNLPVGITAQRLLSHIRGGPISSLEIFSKGKITGGSSRSANPQTAVCCFTCADNAQSYFDFRKTSPLVIDRVQISTERLQTSPALLSTFASRDASRCLLVQGVSPSLSIAAILDALRNDGAEVASGNTIRPNRRDEIASGVTESRRDKRGLCLEFTSIDTAAAAAFKIACLRIFEGSNVSTLPDPCAEPLHTLSQAPTPAPPSASTAERKASHPPLRVKTNVPYIDLDKARNGSNAPAIDYGDDETPRVIPRNKFVDASRPAADSGDEDAEFEADGEADAALDAELKRMLKELPPTPTTEESGDDIGQAAQCTVESVGFANTAPQSYSSVDQEEDLLLLSPVLSAHTAPSLPPLDGNTELSLDAPAEASSDKQTAASDAADDESRTDASSVVPESPEKPLVKTPVTKPADYGAVAAPSTKHKPCSPQAARLQKFPVNPNLLDKPAPGSRAEANASAKAEALNKRRAVPARGDAPAVVKRQIKSYADLYEDDSADAAPCTLSESKPPSCNQHERKPSLDKPAQTAPGVTGTGRHISTEPLAPTALAGRDRNRKRDRHRDIPSTRHVTSFSPLRRDMGPENFEDYYG